MTFHNNSLQSIMVIILILVRCQSCGNQIGSLAENYSLVSSRFYTRLPPFCHNSHYMVWKDSIRLMTWFTVITMTVRTPSQILQLYFEIQDTNNSIQKTTTHTLTQSRHCVVQSRIQQLTHLQLILLGSCHQMWSKWAKEQVIHGPEKSAGSSVSIWYWMTIPNPFGKTS